MDQGPGGHASWPPRPSSTRLGQDLRSHGFMQRASQAGGAARLAMRCWCRCRPSASAPYAHHRQRGPSCCSRAVRPKTSCGSRCPRGAPWSRRRDRASCPMPATAGAANAIVEDWAPGAARHGGALPARVLTMHGPALTRGDEIPGPAARPWRRRARSIADQAVQGVNAGLRPDQIAERIGAPARAGWPRRT